MANTTTVRALVDGPNVAVLHVYLASDGASGELTDYVVFDASALIGAVNAHSIMSIQGLLTGFSAKLEFDATTDTPALFLPSGEQFDFNFIVPINNNAGTGITGDIVLTTTGFTASGDEGFFIIKVRK